MEKAYSLECPPKAEYSLYEQGLYGTSPALRHLQHNSYTYENNFELQYTLQTMNVCVVLYIRQNIFTQAKISLFKLSLTYLAFWSLFSIFVSIVFSVF